VELHEDGWLRTSQVIEALGTVPALFSDPANGLLLNPAAGLRVEAVRVLVPSGSTVSGIDLNGTPCSLQVSEELQQPSGSWTGYTHTEFKLDGIRALTVREGPTEVERRIAVRPAAEQPKLLGVLVPGVMTTDGCPVYS
jgi:hypothetical protein